MKNQGDLLEYSGVIPEGALELALQVQSLSALSAFFRNLPKARSKREWRNYMTRSSGPQEGTNSMKNLKQIKECVEAHFEADLHYFRAEIANKQEEIGEINDHINHLSSRKKKLFELIDALEKGSEAPPQKDEEVSIPCFSCGKTPPPMTEKQLEEYKGRFLSEDKRLILSLYGRDLLWLCHHCRTTGIKAKEHIKAPVSENRMAVSDIPCYECGELARMVRSYKRREELEERGFRQISIKTEAGNHLHYEWVCPLCYKNHQTSKEPEQEKTYISCPKCFFKSKEFIEREMEQSLKDQGYVFVDGEWICSSCQVEEPNESNTVRQSEQVANPGRIIQKGNECYFYCARCHMKSKTVFSDESQGESKREAFEKLGYQEIGEIKKWYCVGCVEQYENVEFEL
jgi:hypothetical protein